MRPYFAYGSNMDHEQMSARCSGATPLATAVLAAHRFVINSQGVATVVSDPVLRVHGLLWSLTDQHESDLDEYEGVAEGIYRKEKRQVTVASGERVEALIYVAADCEEGPAQPGYFDRIVSAAARLAFPAEYQRELGEWRPK
jgi:gamma-glutamylcyclotransferase (GGCT)/AIG2-like uncharacterized protein YtfP